MIKLDIQQTEAKVLSWIKKYNPESVYDLHSKVKDEISYPHLALVIQRLELKGKVKSEFFIKNKRSLKKIYIKDNKQ